MNMKAAPNTIQPSGSYRRSQKNPVYRSWSFALTSWVFRKIGLPGLGRLASQAQLMLIIAIYLPLHAGLLLGQDPTLVGAWPGFSRGEPRSILVMSNTAYLGHWSGGGMMVLDLTNPALPVLLGQVGNQQGMDDAVQSMAISGQYIYMAQAGGLTIVDVSDPSKPEVRGATPASVWWGAWGIAVSGNYAFLANDDSGVQVINVSDRRNPATVATIPLQGRCRDIAIVGKYALVAASDTLIALDVSDAENPVLVDAFEVATGAFHLAVAGNYAYVAGGCCLNAIDISDPHHMGYVGGVYFGSGNITDVAVAGERAFVTDYFTGLNIVDVSDPTNCVEVAEYSQVKHASSVAAVGNYAFVTDGAFGLVCVGAENGKNPSRIGEFETAGQAVDLTIKDNRAYVADRTLGLQIIDVLDRRRPKRIGGLQTGHDVSGVAVADRLAYLAANAGGLQIVDVSDPAKSRLVGGLLIRGEPRKVTVVGGLAYLACGDAGLQVVDVRDPAHCIPLGSLGTGGIAVDLAVDGRYAYVANGSGGIQVTDVSNPNELSHIGRLVTQGAVVGLALWDKHVCLADTAGGLSVIDVGDPAQPRLVGSSNDGGLVAVRVMQGRAYGVRQWGGLRTYELGDPMNPVLVSATTTGGFAMALDLDEDYVYVANLFEGLAVLSLPEASPPRITNSPSSRTVIEGDSSTFEVGAAGSAPLAYAWYKDGQPLSDGPSISGSASRILTLIKVLAADGGSYSVTVRNSVGSVRSDPPARLTIVSPPRITRQPSGHSLRLGTTATLAVEVQGTPPFHYQWRQNGAVIPRSDGASLTMLASRVQDAGNYDVIVTNDYGLAHSQIAEVTLRLIDWDSVWSYEAKGIDLGSYWRDLSFDDAEWLQASALFHAGAIELPQLTSFSLPIGPTTYYFRHRFHVPPGLSPSMLRLRHVLDDGAIIYLNGQEIQRVGMESGSVRYTTWASRSVSSPTIEGPIDLQISNMVVGGLNVVAAEVHQDGPGSPDMAFGFVLDVLRTEPLPPIITTQLPAQQWTASGMNVDLEIEAYGSPPLSYEWRKLGDPLVLGSEGARLSLTGVSASDAGDYYVVVTNPAGSATSALSRLNVTDSGIVLSQPQATENGFAFEFGVVPSRVYSVETSTDLVSWGLLLTTNSTGPSVRVTEPGSTLTTRRFYRVRTGDR